MEQPFFQTYYVKTFEPDLFQIPLIFPLCMVALCGVAGRTCVVSDFFWNWDVNKLRVHTCDLKSFFSS